MGSTVADPRLLSTVSVVVVYTSLVTPRHVGSSRIRGQTYVSCTGRWVFTTDSSGKPQCRECLREKKKPSFFEVKNNFGGKLLKNYRGHLDRNSKEKGKVDRDQFSHTHPPVGNKWGRKHYNSGDCFKNNHEWPLVSILAGEILL